MQLREDLSHEVSGLSVTAAVAPRKTAAVESLQRLNVPFIDATSTDWTIETTAYNLRRPAIPALIVYANTPKQVQDAVACGVQAGLKVSARCGNHSYASLGLGGEDDHLVVDLTPMHSVIVDENTKVATVEAGARLGHVASELLRQGGRAIAHGSCPGVGIAGHLLHGGYGWASHNKGLALDWLISANIVLANGTHVHCSTIENPDLFWALRGAGSNFGIVTSFELKTFEAPIISTPFKVPLNWHTESEKAEGVKTLVEFARTTPPELNMRLGAFVSGDHSFEGVYYGRAENLTTILAPLLKKTGGILTAKEGSWLEGLEYYAERNVLVVPDPYIEHGNFYATSLTLQDLKGESLYNFVHFWHSKAINFHPGGWFIQLDLHGGPTSAISSVPSSATAYAHRDKRFLIQLYHYADNERPYPPEAISMLKAWIETTTKPLQRGEWGMYMNYVDSEVDRDTAEKLYYGENLWRLRELKKRFDPAEVFYYPQAISPAK
ncbi:hypothetical protein N0V93_003193 [Gnomoniopsis smithogilvyi]|uniref:FAD-binding PCMH-type domain-containing protein n=1 Tax=Gnomoniopsis smithogilvyi TaxID=1191159 RepID=A0A9W8YY71_9PEZI|nr:hypothetical protein N0V93_003193 [Gnomoniopsis smithogilvyi]